MIETIWQLHGTLTDNEQWPAFIATMIMINYARAPLHFIRIFLSFCSRLRFSCSMCGSDRQKIIDICVWTHLLLLVGRIVRGRRLSTPNSYVFLQFVPPFRSFVSSFHSFVRHRYAYRWLTSSLSLSLCIVSCCFFYLATRSLSSSVVRVSWSSDHSRFLLWINERS